MHRPKIDAALEDITWETFGTGAAQSSGETLSAHPADRVAFHRSMDEYLNIAPERKTTCEAAVSSKNFPEDDAAIREAPYGPQQRSKTSRLEVARRRDVSPATCCYSNLFDNPSDDCSLDQCNSIVDPSFLFGLERQPSFKKT